MDHLKFSKKLKNKELEIQELSFLSDQYYGVDLDEGEQEYVEEDEYDRAAKY